MSKVSMDPKKHSKNPSVPVSMPMTRPMTGGIMARVRTPMGSGVSVTEDPSPALQETLTPPYVA